MQINSITAPVDHDLSVERIGRIAQPAKVVEAEPRREAAAVVERKQQAERLGELQAALTAENISLKFRRDDATRQLVVEMVDDTTGTAIRQIPTEVSLRLGAVFARLQGQIVNKEI